MAVARPRWSYRQKTGDSALKHRFCFCENWCLSALSPVFVAGAGGFIGRHLMRKLREAGHSVRALPREPPEESLAGADAIINLAGEPVAQRWTNDVKQRIRASRVDGTRHIVNALSTQSHRPRVLVNASAVGIYGSRGDEILTEASPPGDDFLARLAVDWEQTAMLAASLGIRVVCLRFGVVLGTEGGALAKMLPAFKLGVGGKLGSGAHWMSWIHIDDVVNLILFAMENPALQGPVNATSPHPVTNAQFTKALAAAIHRPAILPVPRLALKLLFGEMSSILLSSARVLPKAAQAAGFEFQNEELSTALARLVARGRT